MAATVTGIFRIIDRASGPLKAMERQARRTQAAFDQLAASQDKLASSQTTNQMNQQAQAAKKIDSTSRGAADAMGRMDRATRQLGGGMRDTDRAGGGLISTLGRLATGFAGLRAIMLTIKFGAMAVAVTMLVQAIGVLAGGVTALIPALGALGGALAALPAMIGGVVQGIGTIAAAFGGVGEAIKAGAALQQDAARTARDAADQQRQAADQLRGAQRGVELAARGVRNSEEGLVLAHRNSADATRRLTEARRSARRELTDMDMAARRAALGARGADLALRSARERLAQLATDPGATDIDMAQQELAVEEAVLSQRESRINRRRSRVDARRAQARGVRGNEQVVAALRGVEEAQRGIRDASEGVADAMYAQGEAARQLAQAQEQSRRVMEEGTAAQQKFRQAMENLSPEARSFVRRLISMRGAMQELRASAGREMFPLLERAVGRASRLFPVLNTQLQRTGGILGQGALDFAEDMTTPERLADVNTVMEHQGDLLGDMLDGLRNMASGFTDLIIAARPFTDWLSETVKGWTNWFSATMATGRATGRIREVLERVRTVMERFGRILRNVGGILRNVFSAAWPLGERLWDSIERGTARLRTLTGTTRGMARMEDWFNRLYDPLSALWGLVTDLAGVMARLAVAPGFTRAIEVLRGAVPYLERLLMNITTVGPGAANLLTQIVRLLSNMPFGPVRLVVSALGGLLSIVNALLEKIPGLGIVLMTLVTAGLLSRVVRFAGRVTGIAAAWNAVRVAAGGAAAAQTAATTATTTGAARTAATAAGGGLLARTLLGPRTALGRATGRFGQYREARGLGFTRRESLSLSRPERGGSRLGRIARGAGGPLAIAGGLGASVLGESIGGKAGGALAGAGTGLAMGAMLGPVGAALGAVGGGLLGYVTSQSKATKAVQEFGQTADQEFDRFAAAGDDAGIDKLAAQADKLADSGGKGAAKLREFAAQARASGRQIRDSRIAESMESQWAGVVASGGRGASRVLRRLDRLSPGARRRVATSMRAMVSEMRSLGILPANEATRLTNRIDRRLAALKEKARRRGEQAARALAEGMKKAAPRGGGILGMFATPADRGPGGRAGHERGLSILTGKPVSALGFPAVRPVREANRQIRENTRRTGDSTRRHVETTNNAIRRDTQRKWGDTRKAVRTNAEGARKEANTAFTGLLDDATKALVATGQTPTQARRTLRGGAPATGNATGGRIQYRYAGGGRIPGRGLSDTVQVAPGNLAAPGELIVNRHTERRQDQINRAIGAPPLGRLVASERTPHSAPITGRGGRGFHEVTVRGGGHQTGGRIGREAPSGAGVNVDGAKPGFAVLMAHFRNIANDPSLYVMSGFRGGSITTSGNVSNHASGDAVDISNPVSRGGTPGNPPPRNTLDRVAAYISANIAKPPRRDFLWRTTTGGNHYNHIHLGMDPTVTGNLGAARRYVGGLPGASNYAGVFSTDAGAAAAAVQAITLRRRRTRLRGGPGGMAQGAMDAYRRRLLGVANAGAGDVSTAGLRGGTSSANQRIGRQMMLRMGFPASEWPALKALWQGESGWRTTADNPTSDAYGIPQSLPGSKMASEGADWRTNPATQIKWGLKYIKGRYGTPSNAYSTWQSRSPHWYAHGGRVGGGADWAGWNAKGGDFTVNRPTVFGAGERGSERVQITPKGGAARGRVGGVNVTIQNINYSGEGEIYEAVRAEFERLADDLDLVGSED